MVLVVLLGSSIARYVAFAQADPAVGTWHLNISKSTYDPGPPPKSSVVTVESAGQGIKVTAKSIDAAGNAASTQYASSLDGKDAQVTLVGSQDFDTVALKRVDALTVEGARKKNGKVVQTYSRVVSKDGKTMTITTKGTNAKGQNISNVAVYEKH
jgi:hypothetical protein